MLLLITLSLSVQAVNIEPIPYETYIYSSDGDKVLSSTAAYTPSRVIRGSDVGLDGFKTPSDIVYNRSEERRVGKECRDGCRSRWSPYH